MALTVQQRYPVAPWPFSLGGVLGAWRSPHFLIVSSRPPGTWALVWARGRSLGPPGSAILNVRWEKLLRHGRGLS